MIRVEGFLGFLIKGQKGIKENLLQIIWNLSNYFLISLNLMHFYRIFIKF
jgi:hypothetical protein